MSDTDSVNIAGELEKTINEILEAVPQEREREIISRRFGLFDRKETLEQIGELLGVTRERIRQLEKSILNRLKASADNHKIPAIQGIDKQLVSLLSESGRAARIDNLTSSLLGRSGTPEERARVAFVAELSPSLNLINENDNYYQAVALTSFGDGKTIKKYVDEVVAAIKSQGSPQTAEQLHEQLSLEHSSNVHALATISKKLAYLGDLWGLTKWPTVNPKNIRDKIYVVLSDNGQPMHFSKIAKAIKDSSFKRRDVTTQAIHNELIKDPRFVLIGRGIYALDSWGYIQGTVSDVIESVLKEASEPLHRDEIVKRVLAKRQVKETTILLNLQSKPQFKRVAKATYTIEEPATA